MKIVCDTSSLIKLRKAGTLDLLEQVFEQVYIPQAVRGECDKREVEICHKIDTKIFIVEQVTYSLNIGLGTGEREMISLAVEHEIDWVMTDDERAILKAKQQGLHVIRFFDILLAGKKKGLITSVRSHLDRMRSQEEGIERDLYEDILQQANE